VGGDVVETNAELTTKPELLNSDPYGQGWMLRIRLTDRTALDGLLDVAAYEALTSES